MYYLTHLSARPLHLDVRVGADVAQHPVHAVERGAGADVRVVGVRHSVEVGHAATRLQDLVVRGREQAVGQTVPGEERKADKRC